MRTRGDEGAHGGGRCAAPRKGSDDHELRCFRRQRRQPLDEQELVDAELAPGGDQCAGEGFGDEEDRHRRHGATPAVVSRRGTVAKAAMAAAGPAR